ncbi:MAG: LysR family transcriptional regulator [Alphaproteobacteria bacterium]|nr:LysR family transcriptional regulator [Alphaproteobacteria bacterium]
MSHLPLRSVEAFAVVARTLNLAQASATLNITIPAVSRRIQILERHLGVSLFHRLPKGLALTAAGEKYIAELGPAWDTVRAATANAKASDRRGALKISVMPTFAVHWLLPRLARDREIADLEVELETSPDIVDLGERSDLDCAIRLGRGPWPGIVGHKVLPVEAYPVASPGFVAANGLRGSRDVARHPLIGSNHQPDFWPEWFRLTGTAKGGGGYRSFDNLQLIYEAATAGLGIAIGLDPLVQPYLTSGRLVRLSPGGVTLSRSFHLVRRADRSPHVRFDSFRRWLVAQAAA